MPRRFLPVLTVSLAVVSFAALGTAQDAATPAVAADIPSASTTSAAVDRGGYLANHVAMCVQCHSPRDRAGNLQEDRLFLGGAIPVESPFEAPRWAFHAPNLRNVPGYTQEQFVTLLTTGRRPSGDEPRSPMPQFRMTEEDAAAVFAYLRSLR